MQEASDALQAPPPAGADAEDASAARTTRPKIFKPFAAVTAATHLVQKRRFSMPFGDIMMTVLMHACATGNAERVRTCLEPLRDDKEALELELAAADDWAQSTCLHWAAFGGNVQVVQSLLAVGAKVDATNQRDASLPIHLAARYGKVGCLIVLADDERGRKLINSCNRSGNTPLHEASYEGRADCAEALLNRAATLEMCNSREKGGLTPLLAAIEYGRLGAVEVLLRHGANMHIAPVDPSAIKPPRLHRQAQLSTTNLVSRRRSFLNRQMTRGASSFGGQDGSGGGESGGSGRRRFDIPGEPAISLALSATHLNVALELLLWRMRKGSGPPLILTPRQLKEIVFDVWALEGVGSMSINVAHFAKLFTTLLLCAKPQASSTTLQELAQSPDILPGGRGLGGGGGGGGGNGGGGEASAGSSERSVRWGGSSFASDGEGSSLRSSSSGGDPLRKSAPSPRIRFAPPPDGAAEPPPSAPPRLLPKVPQNPVLLALQLASHCGSKALVKTRNRLVNERISDAAALFEHLASGLLECAARAAVQAEEQKSYNPWRMGTQQLHPEVARDLFVHDCVELAAEHELKIFIAHPLVFNHLHELFWPTSTYQHQGNKPPPLMHEWRHSSSEDVIIDAAADGRFSPAASSSFSSSLSSFRMRGWAVHVAMALLNVALLPLLPFLPVSLEHELEEAFRIHVVRGELPFGIIWLLPAGRFATWFASALTLACVITKMPPVPVALGGYDFVLLLYSIGWAHSEWNELTHDIKKYGRRAGGAKYFRDPFNLLDVSMIVVMAFLLVARATTAFLGHHDDPGDAAWSGPGSEQEAEHAILTHNLSSSAWHQELAAGMSAWGEVVHDGIVAAEVPCQAMLSLSAWLRIMEVLFIFPNSGPLLLMAIRMLEDLVQFLTLASFVVVAFGCSFYVLLTASLPISDDGSQTEVSRRFEGGELTVREVVRWLVQGTLKGESDYVIEVTKSASPISWALMVLFGVIVVLLLLNLLIARFAKTFDMVYENVEHNFKVAFARVVIDGCNKELTPPPINLVRTLVLYLYRLLRASGFSAAASEAALKHGDGLLPDVIVDWLKSADGHETGVEGILHAYHPLGAAASHSPHLHHHHGTKRASSNDDDDENTAAESDATETAIAVEKFLRKATDTQVALLPEGVVEYVNNHQHDVVREERWRTAMQKDISAIEMQLSSRKGHGAGSHHLHLDGGGTGAASTSAQLQRVERALAEMSGSLSQGQASRVRDLEATVSALTNQLDKMQTERQRNVQDSLDMSFDMSLDERLDGCGEAGVRVRRVITPTSTPPPDEGGFIADDAAEDALFAGTVERAAMEPHFHPIQREHTAPARTFFMAPSSSSSESSQQAPPLVAPPVSRFHTTGSSTEY